MRRPNFFIVGEPKSGTTALHEYLAQHPDIFMSPFKEPRYFCSDLHRESDAYHRGQRFFPIRTEPQYLEVFRGAEHQRIVGESSTQYLRSTEAARNIAAFCPDARILAMFREPVDLLHSLFMQLTTNSDEDAPNLEAALALEPARRQGRALSRFVGCPSYLYYSEWVRYATHLRRYLEVFPREQVMVRTFDEFVAAPATVYRDVLEFLGVDTSFRPTFRVVNPTTVGRFPRVRRLVRSRLVWEHVRPAVPVALFQRAERLMHWLFDRRADKVPVSPELRSQLRERYRPEVEELSPLIDRDLVAQWGYAQRG